mmetsp:Transcript_7698/g.11421  ORF Transcript_7698/g.11421 Transcript_7698/m.11421 type:complete len:503 (+) Transcript_7698:81-1589(+)|eukprot:CAMPEP_0185024630 /NCGR_PEP_ID=MMETSP1103-20130426/7784_1 /TAXON_ID=36769 /ORGANISM="Paraphysomonas bandaiensis, Strain Caron Lab Isolate" /LENGTH=502 /DNA_ID=CAMNT_0027557647 /DNA_START=68 /DNA_END=1576 /DNA_ORIENTATION=-
MIDQYAGLSRDNYGIFGRYIHVITGGILVVAVLSWLLTKKLFKAKSGQNLSPFQRENSSSDSVLSQIDSKERWMLQSRVANARTTEDFFSIFNEFELLHKLKLPVSTITEEPLSMREQAFRDLVRDKININDIPVVVDVNSSDPKKFQPYFHGIVQNAIAHHAVDKRKRDVLATHICCHLSRTRAGGDSLFAVKDIFDSPQLTITASHTDTHPPTDLHVTDDGWATITTTSNFDVYLFDSLHAPDMDMDTSGSGPTPLVTLSARLEEAITVSDDKQLTDRGRPISPSPSDTILAPSSMLNWLTSTLNMASSAASSLYDTVSRSLGGGEYVHDMPTPLYRRMSIVCFDPKDPTRYGGGVDSSEPAPGNPQESSDHSTDHNSSCMTSCYDSSISKTAEYLEIERTPAAIVRTVSEPVGAPVPDACQRAASDSELSQQSFHPVGRNVGGPTAGRTRKPFNDSMDISTLDRYDSEADRECYTQHYSTYTTDSETHTRHGTNTFDSE